MAPVNTTARLAGLRAQMKDAGVDIYVVPSSDSHQSEWTAPSDERRRFISGFSGSAGTAIITTSKAALSTDGRYFLQAERELDGNWELLKRGVPGHLSWIDWIAREVEAGLKTVSVDPAVVQSGWAKMVEAKIEKHGGVVKPVDQNLVDAVWGSDRPPKPHGQVHALDIAYTGQSIADKLAAVRVAVEAAECSSIVLSALDDVAWLFNLRGSDIPFNPVFMSYAIVTPSSAILFVDRDRVGADALATLEGLVDIQPYESIFHQVRQLAVPAVKAADKPKPVFVADQASWRLVDALGGPSSVFSGQSPVTKAKSVKNPVELAGMRAAHYRDGAAIIRYFAWLEDQLLKQHAVVDEVAGADRLDQFRAENKLYRGMSFETISSAGPNAAIIHYSPVRGDCAVIDPTKIYLCDSGGHYLDGTTDTTRTIHFGTPTEKERTAYTLVLKGHIAVDRQVFPVGTTGASLDPLARQHLWLNGLDYRHSTGHGVGSYLCVHEGPVGISSGGGYGRTAYAVGNVLSNEPGYYEDGSFGIRIESVVIVQPAETKFKWADVSFLRFEPATMVPMCRNLIDVGLLTDAEIDWVDSYHRTVVEKTAEFVQADPLAAAWLERETSPL